MNINKFKLCYIATLVFVFSICELPSQALQNGMVMDKVVARVGSTMILKSDVESRLLILAQNNPQINPADISLWKQQLEAIIEEKLIIEKAVQDSIPVSEQQINQRWDMYLKSMVQQYGDESRIEKLYGMSISELRRKTKHEIKNYELQTGIIQKKFGEIKVSAKEVSEFYKSYVDSLPEIPISYELFRIVKDVKVNASEKNDIIAKAQKLKDSLSKGADFVLLAEKYSDDIYTKADGGNLGWFEKSKLFPEFVKGVQNLQQNEISKPIETPLGIHIIQLLDKTDDKINTRHILLKFGNNDKNKTATLDFLKTLTDSIKSGADFSVLAKKHSDDKETKGFGGNFGAPLTAEEIPESIGKIVQSIKDGEISEPIPFSENSYQIILRKRTIPAHKPTVENDYAIVEHYTMLKKRETLIKKWIQELRKEVYVEYVN